MMDDNFEQAAEQFLQEMVKEHYLNGAGLKETMDIVSIYDKFGWLFTRETVDSRLNWTDTETRYLADFAIDGYIDGAVKHVSEKITNGLTQATVEWQGEQVPYRRASVIISNEPDSEKRHDLESRTQKVTEKFNPDRLERMQMLHAQTKSLGFASYLETYDNVRDLRLSWLRAQTDELLEQTDQVFDSELDHYLGEIGVSKEDATPADLSFLFRAPQFDGLFPQEKLLPSLRTTLAGMGIDLDSQQNVRLDTESRPLKSPRAFCAPVQVPDEVYLVIAPKGGQDDYRALMHEAGHAEHFGFTSPDLPFAFKRLGDVAVTESYAFLMEHLLKSPRWLSEIMEEHNQHDYLRQARFSKLWLVRRYAAKLQYEMMLHTTDDITNMRDKYAEILGKALKINISPVNYLSDVDDGLYAAGYLRAWIFEVMLRKHLEENYTAAWFKTPAAGEFLKGLWSLGEQHPVDELAHQLRYEHLDAEPLILEMAR